MTRLTPLKAIRLKCIDCCAYLRNEIKACNCIKCPLWDFRLSKDSLDKRFIKTPYLYRKNFEGLENKKAIEVIKILRAKIEHH